MIGELSRTVSLIPPRLQKISSDQIFCYYIQKIFSTFFKKIRKNKRPVLILVEKRAIIQKIPQEIVLWTWRAMLHLRQKKAHICLPRQCVLFSTKFALAGKWNSSAVKYLLRKCEIFADANVGKFHFTLRPTGAIFHNSRSELFHIRQRRIFHLKSQRFCAIISFTLAWINTLFSVVLFRRWKQKWSLSWSTGFKIRNPYFRGLL